MFSMSFCSFARGAVSFVRCSGISRPFLLLVGGFLMAAPSSPAAERRQRTGLLQEDFPVQGACISANFPSTNTAMKGLAIRLAGENASVLFDTDLLRLAAGWTGGYITTRGVAFDGAHSAHPKIAGEQKFGAPPIPGWA